MSILAEARKYGIQFEIIGNTVKARATRPVPLEVVKKFKERKSEIIRLLKNQNNKHRFIEQASNTVPETSEGTGTRRWCTGYQPPRYVHTDVCSWHIQEGDPKCANCPHLTLKDKENLMGSYLDKTIEKLNAHCAVYYKPTDLPARRALIDSLEKEITETYLSHNVVEFIKVVDKWAKMFLSNHNPDNHD